MRDATAGRTAKIGAFVGTGGARGIYGTTDGAPSASMAAPALSFENSNYGDRRYGPPLSFPALGEQRSG